MIEVLIRYFSNESDADKKIKTFKKINDAQVDFVSKVFSLFTTFFAFTLFVFSLISFITSMGFLLTGKLEEELKLYFIIGSVVSVVFSLLFYKLMKKSLKKLKQPIERELDLKI